jgi:hypothetical protein
MYTNTFQIAIDGPVVFNAVISAPVQQVVLPPPVLPGTPILTNTRNQMAYLTGALSIEGGYNYDWGEQAPSKPKRIAQPFVFETIVTYNAPSS